MGALLEKIDDGLYRIERWIAVVASIVMAIVVFFDVVHRRYSSVESKLVEKLGAWTGMDPEGSTYQSLQDASGMIVWALTFGIVYFGIRSASSRPLLRDVPKPETHVPVAAPKAAGLAAVICVGTWFLLRILFGSGVPEDIIACDDAGFSWKCGMYPNGVTWAQPFALILTLWVGFVGASMATHDNRQLKVEALQRYLPEKVRNIAGLLSGLCAATFCIVLALLAYRYVGYKYDDYIEAGRLGGFYDGIDIPRYQGFLIVPMAYGIMALRFVNLGLRAFRGELDDTPTELADLDIPGAEDGSEDGAEASSGDFPPQSEIQTEDLLPRPGEDANEGDDHDEKGGAR